MCGLPPVFPARGVAGVSQAVGEVLVQPLPPPGVQVEGGEVGEGRVGFLLIIFDGAVV